MKVKSYKKRILSIILAAAMALTSIIAMPFTASAVSTPANAENSGIPVWADAENTLTMEDITQFTAGTKTTMTGAVGIFKTDTSNSKYYLFLPSTANCNNLKIWYSPSYSSVKFDNVAIENGQPTNVLADANEGGVAKSHTLSVTAANGSTTNYSVTVLKSGDVGTVYIDTSDGSISTLNDSKHEKSTTGTIMVINPDGTIEYDGIMEKMSGRGNGTWSASNVKNPYNVKLATSTKLLGMPKAKKWVLLANAGDPSLIRNQLTYDFAKYIGVKYQPTCKPVDLYVNQQYYGSYSLSEKVEIKSNRVNVNDSYENLEIANGTQDPTTGAIVPKDLTGTKVNAYQNSIGTGSDTQTTGGTDTFGCTVGNKKYSPSLTDPSDYTGGYLYELEITQRWMNENAGFCAYNRQGWVLKNCDYATKNMVHYSYDLLYALGGAVYNNGIVPNTKVTTTCKPNIFTTNTATNPAPAAQYQGKKWSDLLDADSAVKYYWTQEYFKNMDSSTSSTYFYKDCDSIDSKLYAGPVWDMDNAICYNADASRWGHSYTSPEDWYTKYARMYRWRTGDANMDYNTDDKSPLNFYAALATNCPDFWTQAESYWHSLIKPASAILLGNAVDPKGILHSTEYYVSKVAKSGTMNNYRINGSTDSYNVTSVTNSINDWLTKRNTFIDKQIPNADISTTTISAIDEQICTGSPVEPKLTITNNGATLVEGTDYTVEYSNNTQVTSVAKAVITGKGYYTGTKTIFFSIVKGNIAQVKINPMAYANDTLKATVLTGTDDTLTNFCTYQWKSNGVAIAGATESSYTIEEDKQNTAITVTVTGDGHNFGNTPVTSNECQVQPGIRPEGFSKTIASWDYDYSVNPDALTTADPTGTEYFYTATSGENADSAKLIASVDAADIAKIKWSGADLYTNPKTSQGVDQTPVMGTSKTDLLGWGYFPYFETTVSTVGYEAIKFSAKLGGTKRAPKEWNLQYSVDGVNYVDVPNTYYSIIDNKVMEDAFIDVELPSECNDLEKLYIRMVVNEDLAINGVNTIINQLSGDAAVNNITVKGSSTDVVTELSAPVITTTSLNGEETSVFSNENVVITDTNGGADIFYTIDGGEEIQYNGAFNPFESTAAKGTSATITAFARFEEIESEHITYTVTYDGTSIGEFIFDDYAQNVSNGAVFSTGGVYGESAKMTAVTDGKSQYVPMWNESNGAFAVAPDDGALWSADSGFYFETSTAGYDNICFTAKAYTTASGPKSVKLQYSLNGSDWTDVTENAALSMNATLEQLFMTVALPDECADKAKVYVRMATTENMTASGTELHNNLSKGNLYINNIIISGTDDTSLKMPYTNKTTSYFADKAIKYYSPDQVPMQYAVQDAKSNIIMSGTYPSEGINISLTEGFNPKTAGPYTVSVWAGDDDDRSVVNTRKYYYKGDTVVKFNYNDSSRVIDNYLSADGLSVSNTSGVNTGTLSMYPNGQTPAALSYTNAYGVKVSWASDNMFTATKNLDNPVGNGYWLIKTSTAGYTDLTLNLDQISSNKGPRDWGIAYSTDGITYKYVSNSNVRAISNDATTKPVETYNSLPLPAECNEQEELYIKVFINGGESIDGSELETLLKGNTGINEIELSGVAIPEEYTITFKTVAYEDMNRTAGSVPVEADVYIDNQPNMTSGGQYEMTIREGESFTYYASAFKNTFASEKVKEYATGNKEIIIPIVALDVNGDGFINAKDFAKIRRESRYSATKDYLTGIYPAFHNISEEAFDTYEFQ